MKYRADYYYEWMVKKYLKNMKNKDQELKRDKCKHVFIRETLTGEGYRLWKKYVRNKSNVNFHEHASKAVSCAKCGYCTYCEKWLGKGNY